MPSPIDALRPCVVLCICFDSINAAINNMIFSSNERDVIKHGHETVVGGGNDNSYYPPKIRPMTKAETNKVADVAAIVGEGADRYALQRRLMLHI